MKLLFNSHEVYKPAYIFTQYNDKHYKITYCKAVRSPGFEFIGDSTAEYIDNIETQRVSLSRTKRHIKEICFANDFQYFATITVDSKNCDRYSLDNVQNLLKYTIQEKIRRKNKDFAYIFITEKHKDGAFHFHGLVKNIDLYVNDNGYFSSSAFDNIGYNSFSPIKDYSKTCNYITKYITKECIKNSHNQIYISSRGLKKALTYSIEPIHLPWTYENDFVKSFEFDIDSLDSDLFLKIFGIKDKNFKK